MLSEGAADFHGIEVSTPALYGGHAFVANIHNELCPSGPYCWRIDLYLKLLKNLGLEIEDHGFVHSKTTQEERTAVENKLKTHLDSNIPCSVLNMDNQLITGYDETGFVLAQPWGQMDDVTPGHLTFGSWKEFGDEIHMNFFTIRKSSAIEPALACRENLKYALDLYKNPLTHTEEAYGVGPIAYQKWIKAVENGHGSEHGAWWNGMVWGECRSMASAYFGEIAESFPAAALLAAPLKEKYGAIGKLLIKAADKEMASEDKIKLLEKAESTEASCIDGIAALASAI